MAPAQSLYFKNLLMLAGLSLIFTPENVTDPLSIQVAEQPRILFLFRWS
jgi:hypothetical protein